MATLKQVINEAIKCDTPMQAVALLEPVLGTQSIGKHFEGWSSDKAWCKANSEQRMRTLSYHVHFELVNIAL